MDLLFKKYFYNYVYRFWIILFARLKDRTLVYNYYSTTMFHVLIRFVFHYTFVHALKSLNTSLSRFVLNYYVCPILCTELWSYGYQDIRYQSLIQVAQNYDVKNIEILAKIHLFPRSLKDGLEMFIGWVINLDVSCFNLYSNIKIDSA